MATRSFSSYIDLNGEPVDMSVSEFLAHLATVGDDSEKVNMADDFILNLKEELFMIASSQYQFPNCMRFLKDAIATVKWEKLKCARNEECMPVANNENKNMNEGQTDNVSNESMLENQAPPNMDLDPIRSESSIQADTPLLVEPVVQSEDIGSGPNGVRELNRRQRMVWSVDLHRRFRFAVEALGGPKEAKPKQIQDLLKVDSLTTEQIKSHLQRYRKRLNSRAHRRLTLGSSHNVQNTNVMCVQNRFSLLCMDFGEPSNTCMGRAPTNKTN